MLEWPEQPEQLEQAETRMKLTVRVEGSFVTDWKVHT